MIAYFIRFLLVLCLFSHLVCCSIARDKWLFLALHIHDNNIYSFEQKAKQNKTKQMCERVHTNASGRTTNCSYTQLENYVDPNHSAPLLRLCDHFMYRGHLCVATELLEYVGKNRLNVRDCVY